MTNNLKNQTISEEGLEKLMEQYTAMAQKAILMLQSNDPDEKAKALEELNKLKSELIKTIYSCADKVGMSREQIDQMIKNPAAFLSQETTAK